MMIRNSLLLGAAVSGFMLLPQDMALAQAGVCQQLAPLMQQRQTLLQRANSMGRRNVDPAVACRIFSDLASNGSRTIAFVNTNKEWCQIPDDFVQGLTSSQGQINRVRGQACGAARQRTQLQAQARRQQQQAQQGGAQSTFGGVDGFSGNAWRVPQGAL